jgi:hypothetical protein
MPVAVLLAVCLLVAQFCFLRITCVILYTHVPQKHETDGILVVFLTPGIIGLQG